MTKVEIVGVYYEKYIYIYIMLLPKVSCGQLHAHLQVETPGLLSLDTNAL